MFNGLSSSLTDAVTDGKLSFQPLVPDLGAKLVGVQVTNPNVIPAGRRGVALVLLFPISARFPKDGRLVIQEKEDTKLTSADLAAMANKPPGPRGNFVLTTLAGSAEPALLLTSETGYGRVLFIKRGLDFDITGPYVTNGEALAMAAELSKLLG